MKVLIFSDVHGKKERLEAILEKHPDVEYRISLGDTELKRKFLQKHDIVAIKGNYPFDAGFTYEHMMDIKGRKLLFVHGHKYRVKYGYDRLYYKILEAEADIALHGHTHELSHQEISGKHIINPGAVNHARGSFTETYMTMEFLDRSVHIEWLDARNHNPVKKRTLSI